MSMFYRPNKTLPGEGHATTGDRRPHTAKAKMGHSIGGGKKYGPLKNGWMTRFSSDADLVLSSEYNNAKYRSEQMEEIRSIKETLAKQDIPCSVLTLERAILMPPTATEIPPTNKFATENPEDAAADPPPPEEFKYPDPSSGLMHNPFEVKKKSKKGKKGKKKKK
jgi:hypothetical protein